MRVLFLVLVILAPLPALALSCLAPTIERSFAHYDASEDNYVVVHGRLTLDTSLLPEGMSVDQRPPEMTKIPAELVGSSLARSGFVLPFDQALTLEVSCIGPWCGGIQNGADVLAFVRKESDVYALAISPCGGAVFGTPKPAMLKRVKQCFVKRNCAAD